MAKARKQQGASVATIKDATQGATTQPSVRAETASGAKSIFANEADREAWIRRECAFVFRFVGNEREARRIAEMHASAGNVAAYNALRGW